MKNFLNKNIFLASIGFLVSLHNNFVNAVPARVTVNIDPRYLNHPTPQQWHNDQFINLNTDEKELIINMIQDIIKKLELGKEVVKKQTKLIKQGIDIVSAWKVIVKATEFSSHIPYHYEYLSPIVANLFNTIMFFGPDDFPTEPVNFEDREKVIIFLNKYILKFVNTTLAKSKECLMCIENSSNFEQV